MNYLDPVEHSLASKGLRFANYLVDYIIAGVLQYAIILIPMFMMGDLVVESPGYNLLLMLISLSVYYFYYVLTEYFFKGKTIAKFITGTKTVTVEGNDLDFNKSLIRSLCRFIPFDVLSFFGDTGWHDSISKTRVVNQKEFEQNKLKFDSIDQIGQIGEQNLSSNF